jgi:hypothetical protein
MWHARSRPSPCSGGPEGAPVQQALAACGAHGPTEPQPQVRPAMPSGRSNGVPRRDPANPGRKKRRGGYEEHPKEFSSEGAPKNPEKKLYMFFQSYIIDV